VFLALFFYQWRESQRVESRLLRLPSVAAIKFKEGMVLLSIIRKNKLKERELRILFLGLDNSGKSTILKRIQGKDIDSVSPTLGFDIFTLLHNG
jgi:ribosome biogenesis GTPase A